LSLDAEKLKELIEVQKDTLKQLRNALDAMTTLKDEINDKLADMNKELLAKIHTVDTFCRNILEPNQKTLYKKMLDLAGQETEGE